VKVERDTAFDTTDYFSGGVRLLYDAINPLAEGLKEGVLLEAGFDDVSPHEPRDISSWAYDHAADKVAIVDNGAKGVVCYDPRYTFVEKLQTISTKYRRQQAGEEFPVNFMRHYYDVYSLLERSDVQAFIGTDAYEAHRKKRFRAGDDTNIAQNQAFILSDPATRRTYAAAFTQTSAFYYGNQPTFAQVLERGPMGGPNVMQCSGPMKS
jgi:hypothetical protein